jgi:uncharacterized membrane protein
LNLVLAGIIAMALVRFAMHGPFFGHGPSDPLGQSPERVQVHMALSPRTMMHVAPEKADEIRSLIRTHRSRIDALREESMAARRHVLDVFAASNFDKATFERSVAQMQSADTAFETEILKLATETALTLTPEERQKAAAWRGHRGPGHGMDWRHGPAHDGDEPPPPGQQTPPGPPPPQ